MNMKKKAALIPKVEDSLFYYEIKQEYLYNEVGKRRSTSDNSVKTSIAALNKYHTFITTKLGKPLEKICFSDYGYNNLNSFRNWMHDENHMSPATINQRLSLVRSFLDYASCIDDSIMPIYLKSKKVKKIQVPDNPIEYYTEEQMKALLSSPDRNRNTGRRNGTILALEYDAALRIGEIPLITVGDVKLDEKIPKIIIHGKGGTIQPVPLSAAMTASLRQYMDEFHKNSDSTIPLFYHMYGNKEAISVDTIENIIETAVESCISNGIYMPESNHSHMFRKSRAMHLYQRGIPLQYIQQLLRHKHMDTTHGFYAFATMETLKEVIENADKEREEGREKKWIDPATRKILEKFST